MNSLNILVNDTWLDLDPNLAIKYRWVNNVFFNRTKQRERTLQFSAADTPNNNRALQYLTKIGTPNDASTQVSCQVYDGKRFVMNATLKVKRTDRRYHIHLLGEWGSLHDLFGNKTFDDLTWNIETPSLDEAEIRNGDYPDFPFWNPAVYWFNCVDQASPGTQQEYHGLYNYLYSHDGQDVRRGVARHAPYLLHLFDGLAASTEISTISEGPFASDPELRKLIMLSTGRITETSQIAPSGFLPNMKVVDFFESIEKMFCCTFLLDLGTRSLKTVFHKATANSIEFVDWTDKLVGEIQRDWENRITGFKYTWDKELLNTYTPYYHNKATVDGTNDWMRVPFLEHPSDNRFYHYSENSLFGPVTIDGQDTTSVVEYVGNIQDPEKFEVYAEYDTMDQIDLFDQALDKKLVYVKSRYSYYWITNFAWRYQFHKYQGLKTTEDSNYPVAPKVFPAFMDQMGPRHYDSSQLPWLVVDVDDTWRLPCVKGASFHTGSNENDSDQFKTIPQLAFKRGLAYSLDYNKQKQVIEGTNYQYAYASSDEFDPDETDSYNYSLHWDGPKGLYNTWWKDWADVLTGGQEITAMINLNHTDINNLDFTKPVYLKGAKCFILELELRIPLTGPTKVKFLKV